MKTNRTLEILRTYNFAQKNHWQLMCDLSNNDYDISYFSGRETVNDNLNYVLQIQEDEGFDIDDMLNQLQGWHDEGVNEQQEFYKENNCYNENIRGWLDELQLIMKIIKQQY